MKPVLLALQTVSAANPLAGYPPWLVVLGGTIAVALALWIFSKVVKGLIWLLLIAVLIAGGAATLWLLLHPDSPIPGRTPSRPPSVVLRTMSSIR